jgi:hypothetical protein
MKTKSRVKKILIVLLLVVIALTVLSYITGYSVVLPIFSDRKAYLKENARPGDELAIFSKFDFSKGDWAAYIAIGTDDFNELHAAIPKRSCLKTTNRQLLQQMKKSWIFKVTEGDAGTVASDFYLFRNGKLVYKSGIILLKTNQRLENEEYGEMIPLDSVAVVRSCQQFQRVYWPIVIL